MRKQHRIWKRGKVYWCSYYVGKRRIRETTRCTTLKGAEAYLADAERRARSPGGVSEDAPHSVTEACNWLIKHGMPHRSPATRSAYTDNSGHLVRLLGEV